MWWKKRSRQPAPTESITVGNIVGSDTIAIGSEATASKVTAGELTALDNAFAQVRSRYREDHGPLPAALDQALAELQSATTTSAGPTGSGESGAAAVGKALETIRALAPPVLDILGQVLGGLPAVPGVGLLLGELGRLEPPG